MYEWTVETQAIVVRLTCSTMSASPQHQWWWKVQTDVPEPTMCPVHAKEAAEKQGSWNIEKDAG